MPGLDIAIIGGGVCGLACAVTLKKHGIKASVYEAAAQFGEVGAGIGLGPNVLNIMRDLGLYDEILAHTPEPGKLNITGFRYVFGAEGHKHVWTYPAKPHEYGAAIHRASYLDVLSKHLDPSQTFLGKRCIAIETSATESTGKRSVLRFKDGTSAEADVVLIANGINSNLREVVTGIPSTQSVSYSGTMCYRGLVVKAKAEEKGVDTSSWKEAHTVLGVNKHIVIYSIRFGSLINIAAFVSDHNIKREDAYRPPDAPTSETVSTADLLAEYEDFGSDIRNTMGCIDRPLRWYINVVYPHLLTYAKGTVALLGDAAHGMLPHLYAGAGQGVEDGYLLGRLLSHPQANAGNIEEILRVYDEIRRPRSQQVADLSYEAGRVQSGFGKHGPSAEGRQQDMEGCQDFVWSYVLGEDVAIATRRLQENGVWL